jgi:hypothetical protein
MSHTMKFQEPVAVHRDPWTMFDHALGEHGRTKVENNTYLQRDTDVTGDHIVYSVVLYDTAILTFDRTRGSVEVHTGGHRTALTQKRINSYLRHWGLRVDVVGGLWLLVDDARDARTLVLDGMEVAL